MRTKWIADNCRTDGEFQVCVKCGSKVEIISAYMSVHDLRFGDLCAGSGRVMRLVIPFCPNCEPAPNESGCLHEIEPHWDGSKYLRAPFN